VRSHKPSVSVHGFGPHPKTSRITGDLHFSINVQSQRDRCVVFPVSVDRDIVSSIFSGIMSVSHNGSSRGMALWPLTVCCVMLSGYSCVFQSAKLDNPFSRYNTTWVPATRKRFYLLVCLHHCAFQMKPIRERHTDRYTCSAFCHDSYHILLIYVTSVLFCLSRLYSRPIPGTLVCVRITAGWR
jgi:hypothetical protein